MILSFLEFGHWSTFGSQNSYFPRRISLHIRQNFNWLRVITVFWEKNWKLHKTGCVFDNQKQAWRLKRETLRHKQIISCFTRHWEAHNIWDQIFTGFSIYLLFFPYSYQFLMCIVNLEVHRGGIYYAVFTKLTCPRKPPFWRNIRFEERSFVQ